MKKNYKVILYYKTELDCVINIKAESQEDVFELAVAEFEDWNKMCMESGERKKNLIGIKVL